MGIIKYEFDEEGKCFNVGQALMDGWGVEWEGEDALIGLSLQDRKNPRHKVTIKKVDWTLETMRVWFNEGGWLCLDHAIEQFKCINN